MISSFVTQDWLTLTIVFLVVLLTYMHYLYEDRFDKLISISKSNEYFVEYMDKKAPFISVFNAILFFAQLGIFALLLFYIKESIDVSENGFETFYIVLFKLFLFIIGRYLIGKIISFVFGIDKIQGILSFVKFTYISKVAIYILPFIITLSYISLYNLLLLRVTTVLTILLLLFFYGKILLQNQKLIFRNLFYFILYLCTLEITPLIYLFKVIIKEGL